MTRFIKIGLLMLLLAGLSLPLLAQSNTRTVDGGFTVQAVPCATLDATADACAVGTATGDIRGDVTVLINFTSIDPVTFVRTYEGTISIAKNKNHIFYGDIINGTLIPTSQTTLGLSSMIVATDGTGIYDGIAGTLAVEGEIDLTTFTEVDTYQGELTFRANR